jgi:hypothetical protein
MAGAAVALLTSATADAQTSSIGYGAGYHPVAIGAATGAVAVTTAAVIGSSYSALPSGCAKSFHSAIIYYHCGSAWYRPAPLNGGTEYVAVEAP